MQPCFECPLPDCDDRACPLRAAWVRAGSARKAKRPVDEATRLAAQWYHREVYTPGLHADRVERGLPAIAFNARRAQKAREVRA